MNETVNSSTGEVTIGMPPAIAQAIIAVKKQVRQIGQDERNEHGKYRYVSVDRFYERIGPMMAEAGLALLIDETETEVRISETTDRDGNPRKTAWLFAQYNMAFMHESGALSTPMRRSVAQPLTGPQTYGAAQSYIEKQFLRQVFKIPIGERDADETAQGDDAPARGRTAPSGANGARSAPARQQAAPAPSDAAHAARERVKRLQADIDGMEGEQGIAMLADLDNWLVFEQLDRALAEAVPDARESTLDMLRVRAANRRRKLMNPDDGLKAFEV